jgi:hypothetical protein
MGQRMSKIDCFLLACVLENQRVDNEEAILDETRFGESAEEVIGVCWYCGAKLRDAYDCDVVCRECLGEEAE